MTLESFINELKNIDECRLQYLTKVYFMSSNFKIILRLLYIDDIKIDEDYLNIELNDGRVFYLKISEDLEYWSKESLI